MPLARSSDCRESMYDTRHLTKHVESTAHGGGGRRLGLGSLLGGSIAGGSSTTSRSTGTTAGDAGELGATGLDDFLDVLALHLLHEDGKSIFVNSVFDTNGSKDGLDIRGGRGFVAPEGSEK